MEVPLLLYISQSDGSASDTQSHDALAPTQTTLISRVLVRSFVMHTAQTLSSHLAISSASYLPPSLAQPPCPSTPS